QTNPSGVWFSRDAHGSPGSWFPAQPGPAPFIPQASTALRVIAAIVLGVGSVAALVGLGFYSDSFRKVYVVNGDPTSTLTVTIDGVEAGRLSGKASYGDDVANTSFEVRTSSSHRIVVKDDRGREHAYVLDPAATEKGWV